MSAPPPLPTPGGANGQPPPQAPMQRLPLPPGLPPAPPQAAGYPPGMMGMPMMQGMMPGGMHILQRPGFPGMMGMPPGMMPPGMMPPGMMGMNPMMAMPQMPERAEDWVPGETPDQRKYWVHKVTKATSWTEPPVVKKAEERRKRAEHAKQGEEEAGWTEYKDEAGKSYWHNETADRTARKMPPEVRAVRKQKEAAKLQALNRPPPGDPPAPPPRTASPVPTGAADHPAPPRQDGAPAAARESPTPSPTPDHDAEVQVWEDGRSARRVLGQQVAQEQVYATRTERREAFMKMLREYKVEPTATWDEAMKVVINDDRYTALRSKKDKLQVFEDYCGKLLKDRRERERLEHEAKVTAFRTMLTESKEASTPISYDRARGVFENDDRWKDLRPEGERKHVFTAYMTELGHRVQERERLRRQQDLMAFGDLLRDAGVTVGDKKSKVFDMLDPRDPRYSAVAERDRDVAFREYQRHLENVEKTKEEVEARQVRLAHRTLRAQLRGLLVELADNGVIKTTSTWHDFSEAIAGRDVYSELLDVPYRYEVFDDFLGRLSASYARDKPTLRRACVARNLTNPSSFTPASFDDLNVSPASVAAFVAECRERLETRVVLRAEMLMKLKKCLVDDPGVTAVSTPEQVADALSIQTYWKNLDGFDDESAHRLAVVAEVINYKKELEARKRKRSVTGDDDDRKERKKEKKHKKEKKEKKEKKRRDRSHSR
ncbi:Pre-mRNA-processing protein 40A [Diplonema papillatum]|nr:Pre-mRNA-processing protein 40A [Diplonema papillatum]